MVLINEHGREVFVVSEEIVLIEQVQPVASLLWEVTLRGGASFYIPCLEDEGSCGIMTRLGI